MNNDILKTFGLPTNFAGFDELGIWRTSSSFLTRCYIDDPVDQVKYETIKHAVSFMNKNGLFKNPMRLAKKPREPKEYMMIGKTRPVGYNYNGDLVGGMDNAAAFDVYLYRKSQW